MPETFDFRGTTADIAGQVGLIWELIRAPLIAPLLRVSVYICLAMSLMLFCERLYMGVVIILVKIFWKKPKKRYNWEPIRDDLESNNASYPMVLVQIPMFNEKEVSISYPFDLSCFLGSCKNQFFVPIFFFLQVYKISIGAACNLSWPSDRLVIQVLDDSTDPLIKVRDYNLFKFVFPSFIPISL